jgi:hypothetical protein
MPDEKITVTPRLRPDGINVEPLALALIEYVETLPPAVRDRLAKEGAELLERARREAGDISSEGAA